LRRFWTYYTPYRSLFILDFSCAIFAAILELSFPLFVSHVVDKLLPSGNWSLTLWACGGLLAVYFLNAVLGFVVNYWGHMLGINIETEMRRSMFHHFQKLSFGFYDGQKTGHLMSRLSTDLMDIGELAHHGPEDVFVAIMTLVGAFAVMLYINAPLAWMTFALVPAMIWIGLKFQGRMSRAFRQMFTDISDINARVENNISGIRVVQAFANESYEKKLFAENNARFRLTKLLAYRIMSWSSAISYLMTRLVSLFVMIAGAWFVFQGKLTNGEFILFLLLSGILFRPIDKINAVMELYPKGLAGFKRYLEIMDTAPDIDDAPNAIEVGRLLGEIEFQNVSFAYENGQQVLKNIDLTIRAGETIAFVGPSGAGKTTLCSLLPRFYDVTGGKITIDGLDIRDVTLHSLRSQIGIVQQDVFLFSGTMRENIAYGNLEASEAEIWEAARRAHLKEFIDAQPDGLETIIGERGVKLSGGQKQRLAIARMFLKNPPILILDEATSALDTETEQIIQQSLAELAEGRTTLVIAHRLATIKNADRIVVVTENGIAEQGGHSELIGAGGVYSRLHNAQFR
ncbi:MAG TPA: ABC transporter ATP-binding protein, partial [Abditibacterium sp.]